MQFRTEIDIRKCPPEKAISHADRIVMLGSCFTDEIGAQLELDGFSVAHNPMGPLFNPASIAKCLMRARSEEEYTPGEFAQGPDGRWHCLDFASRYSHADPGELAAMVNRDLHKLAGDCARATVAIITLGSSHTFIYKPTWKIAGNCHKLPASDFEPDFLTFTQSGHYLAAISQAFPRARTVIFTVSPVRHVAYGLHGNNLGKAHLLLAVEEALKMNPRHEYFPAYEILNDDLRDYRFYAPDMKHPSATAVEYVYEKFAQRYFSDSTRTEARKARSRAMAAAHRPILGDLP